MTLVARTSLFFLAALAIILFGLSAAIYVLMRDQMLGQITEHTNSVVGNLAAAVAELHAVHGPVRGHLLRHCHQQQCYLCANSGVELGDQHGLLVSIMMRHGNAWKMEC